jgi:hypothetical protein
MEIYKTEKVLSLVGAILGTVAFVVILIVGLIFGALGAVGGSGGLVAMAVVSIVFALVSFIFGYIATSKLKKGEKSGGIMAIVAAALALVACIVGFIFAAGWTLIASFALYLTAGIMVLAKKAVPAE